VIDLLGDSDEKLLFFAIHDADAYGTCIFQALQEGTAARPARRVQIVNLGMEPWHGLEMGLPVEPAEQTDKRKPVGNYVKEKGLEWVEWLQTKRIELNAMTTPQFIDWLDTGMRRGGNGKLIPPQAVMLGYVEQAVKERVSQLERERILMEAGFEERVETVFQWLRPIVRKKTRSLVRYVRSSLVETPTDSWRAPLDRMADTMTQGGEWAEGD
jgi:hypothetical protein